MTGRARDDAAAESKRASIRRAAYRSFRDRGYHQTTVDAICRRAKISKGSFYWYFDSKQAVFVDILEQWTVEVTSELERQFKDAVQHEDSLPAIASALQRETHRGRSIVPLWLEFAVHSRDDAALQQALASFFARARRSIAGMFAPTLGGHLDAAQIDALAATIFGAYAGLLIQQICDPAGVDADAQVRQFLGILQGNLRDAAPSDAQGSPELNDA